ncbi:hypothetical protein EV361DRAFT_989689, partial [Lentinula raphanica]
AVVGAASSCSASSVFKDLECLYQSVSDGDKPRSGTISHKNVGTGGDPSNDEYPGGDDGEDDSSDDEPNPSGEESPEERGACERCIRLERAEQCVPQKKRKNATACQPCHDNKQQCTWSGSIAAVAPTRKSKPRKAKAPAPRRKETDTASRLNNLEVDIQALKEGFVDIVQGQHEILELVRDSASSTDGRLQAIERRFSNLEGTLVHLMKKALGVEEDEGDSGEPGGGQGSAERIGLGGGRRSNL